MESFYQGWLSRQSRLLAELLAAPRDQPDIARALISRVLAHYHDYYLEKSRLAARDVLSVLSPSWLTPYEHTFLWVGGWKPSLSFRLLDATLQGGDALSPEQRRGVEELRRGTAAEEQRLSAEIARVQEAMATPQVLGLVRRARDGEARTEAVEAVVRSLELLVGSADALRARVVIRLVEILTPARTMDFLAAAAELHLRIRGWGSATA